MVQLVPDSVCQCQRIDIILNHDDCGTNIKIVYNMSAVVTWLRFGGFRAMPLASFLATTSSKPSCTTASMALT